MVMRLGALAAAFAIWTAIPVAAASAAPKAAVFPFDLVFQQSEEDFFTGPQKATPEEVERLKLVRNEIVAKLAAAGKYEMLDIGSVEADIAAAAPLNKCNGCEMDIAKKLGADILVLGVIEKASATLLSMNVIVVDMAKGGPISNNSAVVQGNTDDAWVGVARWLTKNRLLAETEGAKP